MRRFIRQIHCTNREDIYCFVGLWERKESLVKAKPKMVANLEDVKGFKKEISPELGVTDPISEDIAAYGKERLKLLV